MDNSIEPRIRNWYCQIRGQSQTGGEKLFQVIAVDDDEALIELQHYDGDIEEVTLEEWRTMDVEVTDPPEDFAGPVDDVEPSDFGFSETRSEGERRGQRQEQRRQNLQGAGGTIAEQRVPGRPMAAEGEDGAAAATVMSGSEEERSGLVNPPPETDPPEMDPPEMDPPEMDVERRLRDRSEELCADIERELRKYDEESLNLLADRVADSGEQSSSALLSDVTLAEVTRDVDEIRDIVLALQRLAEGSYGICLDCGEEIETQRLEARPEATRCNECQRRFENRDRREHHRTL